MTSTTDLTRYRELSRLGAGGMATVSLAEDTMLGRRVALKRVHTEGDQRALTRLRREALVGASLSHPNLVAIYDVESTDDDLVIVMEYVQGETLRDAVRRGPIDGRRALPVLEGVALALDAIHARGVVHRDVKPANILLGTDGTIKLADLGIASASDRTRLTSAGIVLGTYSYMAPEQLEGDTSSPAMDVYALAAVAFEVLSGNRAHPEPNPVALAHALATREPPDLRDAWPSAPAQAAHVLRRGMAFDPSERPRSATELVGRLRAALEPQGTAPMSSRPSLPPSPPARPRPRSLPLQNAQATRPRAPRPARSRPTPRGSAGGRWRRGAAIAAVVALAAIGLGLVLSASGGGAGHTSSSQATTPAAPARTAARGSHAATAPAPSAPSVSGPGAPSPGATSDAASPAAATASTPDGAVRSFYQLAASHRFADAWQLADQRFRGQLLSFAAFARQQSAVRSIRFDEAAVVQRGPTSATVAVRTTPVLNGSTQHCQGTVRTVPEPGTGRWLLDHIQIQC